MDTNTLDLDLDNDIKILKNIRRKLNTLFAKNTNTNTKFYKLEQLEQLEQLDELKLDVSKYNFKDILDLHKIDQDIYCILKQNCNHKWIQDFIDITPDKSKYICYCEYCEICF
jgi:Ser-tRNA(Ala) deacylase AlaX